MPCSSPPVRARIAGSAWLDEEMVYESRVGDVFTLGTSTWHRDIYDRVLVTPARSARATAVLEGRPGSAGPPSWAALSAPSCARWRVWRPPRRASGSRRRGSTSGPPTTARLPEEQREAPVTFPTTGPSSSSGSVTRSATGGPCTRRSASRSTRRGRCVSRRGCASASASTCRPCTATTAWCSAATSSSRTAAVSKTEAHGPRSGSTRRTCMTS